MNRRRLSLVACALLGLAVTSCAGGGSGTATSSSRPTTTSSPASHQSSTTSTTGQAEQLSVHVSPSAPVVAAGTTVTFTVTIAGPGVLSVEDVRFGDGGGSGANAGMITCGETARADHTSTYTHAYPTPGSYVFTDHVTVLRPPPICRDGEAVATTTVVVATPASVATTNGVFVSPTANLACGIRLAGADTVRCASFSPPRLVDMTADGATTVCSGNQCDLGNPTVGTAVLPYGSATGDGPFLCLSTLAGVTCTVPSGKGFTISRAGVRTVPGTGA